MTRTIFLTASLLTTVLSASQAVFVGKDVDVYRPLDAKAVERDLREARRQGISEGRLTAWSTRIHPVRSAGSERGAVAFSGRTAITPVATPPVAPPLTITSPGLTPLPVAKSTRYTRSFGLIDIALVDEGFGLTDADRENIYALLAQLPADHLKNIKQIVFVDGPNVIENRKGFIKISSKRDPNNPLAVVGEVAHGIGMDVYSLLSASEKVEWARVAGTRDDVNGGFVFGSFYAGFALNSFNILYSGVGAPEPGEPTPDLTTKLPRALFVASMFASKTTGVIAMFSNNPATGRVSMAYQQAYRFGDPVDQLTVGRFSFTVTDGKITSYGIFEDAPLDQFGRPIKLRSAVPIEVHPPVTPPATLLDRLSRR